MRTFCSGCGVRFDEQAPAYCGSCGTRRTESLDAERSPVSEESRIQRRRPRRLAVVLGLATIAATLLGIIAVGLNEVQISAEQAQRDQEAVDIQQQWREFLSSNGCETFSDGIGKCFEAYGWGPQRELGSFIEFVSRDGCELLTFYSTAGETHLERSFPALEVVEITFLTNNSDYFYVDRVVCSTG